MRVLPSVIRPRTRSSACSWPGPSSTRCQGQTFSAGEVGAEGFSDNQLLDSVPHNVSPSDIRSLQHCVIPTLFHSNILPSQHFATTTFCRYNIVPPQEKRTFCHHQDCATKTFCRQQHCATRRFATWTFCHFLWEGAGDYDIFFPW